MMDAAAAEHQDPVPHRWKIPLDFEVRERDAALRRPSSESRRPGRSQLPRDSE
jgi:hypothetical protein